MRRSAIPNSVCASVYSRSSGFLTLRGNGRNPLPRSHLQSGAEEDRTPDLYIANANTPYNTICKCLLYNDLQLRMVKRIQRLYQPALYHFLHTDYNVARLSDLVEVVAKHGSEGIDDLGSR